MSAAATGVTRPLAIDVRALTKFHGQTAALRDATFSVAAGEQVVVSGPPAAGKSTLLKLLVGHSTATGGRIRIAGFDVRTLRLEVARRVGYVPQVRPSLGAMRVGDVLLFSGRARQIPENALERRLGVISALCGLRDVSAEPADRLEAGVWARVSLAQALLVEPSILLLDAWLDAVGPADLPACTAVLDELRGRTTVLLTTQRADPPIHADRLLLLDTGRLMAFEPPAIARS